MEPARVTLPRDCAAWLAAGQTMESIRSRLDAKTLGDVRRHMLARRTFLENFLYHPGVGKLFAVWGKRTGLAKAATALRQQIAKDVRSGHQPVSRKTRHLAESFKGHYEALDPVPLVNEAIAFLLSVRSTRRLRRADAPVLAWPWLAVDLVASFQMQALATTWQPAAAIRFLPPLALEGSFQAHPDESYPAMIARLNRFYESQWQRYHRVCGKIPAQTAADIVKHTRWFYRIDVGGEPLIGLATEDGCNIQVVQRRLDGIRRLFDLSPYSLR
jgi:hypothetical protein